MGLLTSLDMGGKIDPNNTVEVVLQDVQGGYKGQQKAKPLKPEELPTESEWEGPFTSSKIANVEQNKKNMAQLNEWALAGNLAAIKGTLVFPSPKLEHYKQLLIDKLEATRPPPPPMPKFQGSIEDLHKQVIIKKHDEVTKKFEYLLVAGWPGAVNHPYGDGAFIFDSEHSKHKPQFQAFLDQASKDQSKMPMNVKEAISGLKSSHQAENKALSGGTPPKSAITLGNGILKYGTIIPEGTHLIRMCNFNAGTISELKKAEGAEIQYTSVMETSAAKDWPSRWTGRNTQIDIIVGPGVKGMPIAANPTKEGSKAGTDYEQEFIFAPNQHVIFQEPPKMESDGKLHMKWYMLTTKDNQMDMFKSNKEFNE